MREGLLDHGVFVEEEAHVADDDVVDVGQEFARWMVPELPGPEGVESADTAYESALFREFVVHKAGDRSQCG